MALQFTSSHKLRFGGSKTNIYGRLKTATFHNNVGRQFFRLEFEYYYTASARENKLQPVQPDVFDNLNRVRAFNVEADELLAMTSFDSEVVGALPQLGKKLYELWIARIDKINLETESGKYDRGDDVIRPEKIVYKEV